jgi:hypothetical protein
MENNVVNFMKNVNSNSKLVKVKYLDSHDMMSLDFEKIQDVPYFIFKKGYYYVHLKPNRRVAIERSMNGLYAGDIVYNGLAKCKYDLVIQLKNLGIL